MPNTSFLLKSSWPNFFPPEKASKRYSAVGFHFFLCLGHHDVLISSPRCFFIVERVQNCHCEVGAWGLDRMCTALAWKHVLWYSRDHMPPWNNVSLGVVVRWDSHQEWMEHVTACRSMLGEYAFKNIFRSLVFHPVNKVVYRRERAGKYMWKKDSKFRR